MEGRDDIFEDYMGDDSRARQHGDLYAQGWADADEAIRSRHPALTHTSQGDGDWDRGWNARLAEQERQDNLDLMEADGQ